jgi:hypothetical protein
VPSVAFFIYDFLFNIYYLTEFSVPSAGGMEKNLINF